MKLIGEIDSVRRITGGSEVPQVHGLALHADLGRESIPANLDAVESGDVRPAVTTVGYVGVMSNRAKIAWQVVKRVFIAVIDLHAWRNGAVVMVENDLLKCDGFPSAVGLANAATGIPPATKRPVAASKMTSGKVVVQDFCVSNDNAPTSISETGKRQLKNRFNLDSLIGSHDGFLSRESPLWLEPIRALTRSGRLVLFYPQPSSRIRS
jgi:hypothetical protein